VPLAKVLADSFKKHHPEIDFYICVVDHPLKTRLLDHENYKYLPITNIDFGAEGFELMAAIYDVMEFSTAVKPFVLKHLLLKYVCALYFDPDIRLYDRVDELFDATLEARISLTPHCLRPIVRDGIGTSEFDIMQAGVCNLGYIGVSREASEFVDWWGERLRRDSVSDPTNQLFTDQRWIDLAIPIFLPRIMTSPAYNVAYWNLDQRPVTKVGATYLVGDEPLRFFHFSGFDPQNPFWLSKHQPSTARVSIAESSELAELVLQYRDEVLAHRQSSAPAPTYGWSEAFPGFPLDSRTRRMLREELKASDLSGINVPPSPFEKGGAEKFIEWLLLPHPDDVHKLPRLLRQIYDSRPDLRDAYPEVAFGDLDNFGEWVRTYGWREHSQLRLVCPSWQPPRQRSIVDSGRERNGVDVLGYLDAEMGVGEAGRLLIEGLRSADVDVVPLNCDLHISRRSHEFKCETDARHEKLILCVNADQVRHVTVSLGTSFLDRRHVIGQWFWELEEFPDSLSEAFDFVDEVWTPTSFVANAIRDKAPDDVPVVTAPLPLMKPVVNPSISKDFFGLEDRFLFLFVFDFLSVVNRKNPLGLVKAFSLAFENNEGPILVLKTINGKRRHRELERLKWEVRTRDDIIIIDEYFDSVTSGSLMASCDCYVSLHRSEGLGLTLAEAMSLGKPVIATGYSGNTDFMNEANSILVPFRMTKIGDSSPPYPNQFVWADPDLEFASLAMRRLALDNALATRLGKQAKLDLERNFNPVAVGNRLRKLLDRHSPLH